MRKDNILEKAINNRNVIAYTNGRFSFNKCSNLYKMIKKCGYNLNDIGKSIDVVSGSPCWKNSNKYNIAIVKL